MLRTALIAAIAFAAPALSQAVPQPLGAPYTFGVQGDQYVLNGKPTLLLSGELHYARIPREYWRARLKMARAMGLNTIATYVFWNVHEPTPGVYDFSGQNDLAAFVRIAGEEGLHVLLRAGPYSCAEWEFGGFPAWLLKDPAMATALRTNDPAFMVPAERWLKRLAREMAPLLASRGGPILAVQVENEYGNFGSDQHYLQHMLQVFQATPFHEVMLYTVDPSKALARGSLPGIPAGVNFGTGRAEPGLKALADLRPGQPLFASEYWPGWFDLWGHPHETRPVAPQLKDLDYILDHKASFNLYMFTGGTNFGQMAGASQSTGAYRGNVTSYDYDAPVDEAGHPTSKFFAYRDVILRHTGEKALPVPPVASVISIPEFKLQPGISLWTNLPKPVLSPQPLTMEQVDQAYGYILYRTQLPKALNGAPLKLDHLYDFATVYLDGKQIGTLDRHFHQDTLELHTNGPARLDILVENTGRLNSTKWMRDERKGMRGATLSEQALTGWQIFSFPMSTPPARPSAAANPGIALKINQDPHFAFGSFTLTQLGDSFLDVSHLGKGLIWINGHPLGRFWNIGPQQTLYLPAPWLKKGRNDVAIFELLPQSTPALLQGRMKPILDGPTPGYADDPERSKKAPLDSEFGPKLTAPVAVPALPPQPPPQPQTR